MSQKELQSSDKDELVEVSQGGLSDEADDQSEPPATEPEDDEENELAEQGKGR